MEELENESLSPRTAGRGFVFVIGTGMLGIGLAAGFLLSGGSERTVLGDAGAVVKATFERMMGVATRPPAVEVALDPAASTAAPAIAEIQAAFDPPPAPAPEKKAAPKPKQPASRAAAPRPVPAKSAKAQDAQPKTQTSLPEPPECEFLPASPTHLVLINEIAWMGTKQDSSGEWIELKNNAGLDIPLAGWQLLSEDGNVAVRFGGSDVVKAGGFFILERKHDRVLKKIRADRLFEGTISNRGAWLRLVDDRCGAVDEVDASEGWKKLGGESASKKTLERDMATLDWGTSAVAGGTPAAPNRTELTIKASAAGAPAPVPAAEEDDEPNEAATPDPSAGTGRIVIGEVLAGTEEKSDEEFVELWNLGTASVDLTGWSIKKRSSSGAESTLVSASRLDGRSVPAGGYLLLANQSGWSGDPPAAVTWPGSYTLAYVSNAVVLFDPGGVSVDELSWSELPKGQSIVREGGVLVIGTPTPGR